jgi:hypothetical protein
MIQMFPEGPLKSTVAIELIPWREIFSKGTRTHIYFLIRQEGSGSLLTTFDNIPSGILGTRYLCSSLHLTKG